MRDHVRRYALPGRNLGADPRAERLLAEVRAPRPRHQHGLDRIAARLHPELAEAVERDRADVALPKVAGAEQVVRRRPQLVDRVRQLHVDQPGRVVQALHVVGQPEDRGPLRRVVAADPLEHAGAVVQTVGTYVDASVVPVDELAVHPDLLGRLHG